MIINSGNLDALRVGFSTIYSRALTQASSQYGLIATTVPSTAKDNKYGWLGKLPNMRQWIGDRVVHGLAEHDYAIKNLPFEMTVSVDRDDIEDDNLGVYETRFVEMGEAVAAHPDQMVFGALADGFTGLCYDGQPFFDTDHPVIGEDGTITTVSNSGGGSGTAWYLLCTNRAMKPIIFQDRKKPQFVALDRPEDHNVFSRKEYVYGVDARRNVGYGFWQMAYGSKQTLDATSYEAARVAISTMKGDHGRPLGLRPNLLVVPGSLEGAAREILMSERNEAGATNKWRGTAELLVADWLV